MSEQEIKVPDLGGADEVEVIEIIVSAGDSVEEEDPILTVESDKASVELPSPGAGKITKITVKVGDKVKEGDVVGMMEASAGGSDDAGSDEPEEKAEEKEEAKQEEKSEESKPAPKKASGDSRKETVKVPALDGFDNVPVIEINVAEGDTIEADDPLVTVESDKATMEIPSPYAGKVGKILVSEGDKLSEGDELLEMTVQEGGGEEEEASAPASRNRRRKRSLSPGPKRSRNRRQSQRPSPRVQPMSLPRQAPRSTLARPCASWPGNWVPIWPASRALAPRAGLSRTMSMPT